MYPREELKRLAAHKAVLGRDIARHRALCVTAATRVVAPLVWLDRLLAVGRRLAPLMLTAGAALSLCRARALVPRWRFLARMLRWSPFIFGAMRRIGRVQQRRAAARSGGRAGLRSGVS